MPKFGLTKTRLATVAPVRTTKLCLSNGCLSRSWSSMCTVHVFPVGTVIEASDHLVWTAIRLMVVPLSAAPAIGVAKAAATLGAAVLPALGTRVAACVAGDADAVLEFELAPGPELQPNAAIATAVTATAARSPERRVLPSIMWMPSPVSVHQGGSRNVARR